MSSGEARDYFEFLANLGMTKHFGSMEATRQLIELCHVRRGQDVLDVGCGVGATPRYLAKAVDCHVVGVDLLERMIQQSRSRANAESLEDRTEFVVADARKLPFEDHRFDAVIMESVNVFFEDKREAMREYVRVTRPGGYVGLTEMTWLRPPSPEAEAYFRRVAYARTMEAGGWTRLLEEAGLTEIVGNAYPVDIPQESKGRFERYGCGGIGKIVLGMLVSFFKDRNSRQFLKNGVGGLSQDLVADVGYGVYVGRNKCPSP